MGETISYGPSLVPDVSATILAPGLENSQRPVAQRPPALPVRAWIRSRASWSGELRGPVEDHRRRKHRIIFQRRRCQHALSIPRHRVVLPDGKSEKILGLARLEVRPRADGNRLKGVPGKKEELFAISSPARTHPAGSR